MKKSTTLKTLLLVIMFGFLSSCGGKSDKIHCDDPKCEKCEDCPVVIDEVALKKVQEQTLPNDQVFDYYRDYDERYKTINDFLKKQYGKEAPEADSRSFVFDFNVLKEYIRVVEEESKKRNTTPEGLKITLGVFPDNSKYKYQTSVFLTPTKEIKDSSGKMIQASYTLKDNKIVLFRDLKNISNSVQKGGFTFTSLLQDENGLALNFSKPVPPPGGGDKDFE